MNCDYVPYGIADGMRSIGFDEPCDRFFVAITRDGQIDYSNPILTQIRLNDDDIPAPSYRKAFKWFREKHELYPSIEKFSVGWISRWCHTDGSMGAIGKYDNYEDAELACLRKLIELVKND